MKKILLIAIILFSQILNSQIVLLNESFESGNIPASWLNIDADSDGEKWEKHNATSGHTGDYSAASYSWFNGSQLVPNNWLITPQLQLQNNSMLYFWVSPVSLSYNQEHYYVLLSTTGTNTSSDFIHLLVDETLGSDHTQWQQRSVSLAEFSNMPVFITFVHKDITNVFAIKIDDIQVVTFEPNNDKNLSSENVKIFPNPCDDRLFICTDKKIEQVKIFDLNGKIVMVSNHTELDVYGLSSGMYVLQLQTQDGMVYFQKFFKKM